MKKKYYLFFLVAFFLCITNAYAEKTARALILDAGANVRTGPGTQNTKLASLAKYSYYSLVDDKTYKDTNNQKDCNSDWYHLYYNGVADGYVCGDHVKVIYSHRTDDIEAETDCEKEMKELGFPATYWGGLCYIKEKHPTWNFVALDPEITWQDAIKGESACGWNLIYGSDANKGFIDSTCKAYDSGYVGILPRGIAYYMDPRNFLSEKYIFQFLHLGYDEKFKDIYEPGIVSIIKNAEFYKYHLGIESDLVGAINSAGEELNVSPIFISARILQELGNKDTLYNLYSGVYEGEEGIYKGLYNFYNFGVSDACVQSYGTTYCGLNYAKRMEWNSVDNAIKGGISQLSKNYLKQNQYTLYLQKFNVMGSSVYSKYSHQYMTNISAPSSEASTTYNTYANLDILESSFIFYIPVYKNMDAAIDNTGSGAIDDPESEKEKPSTIPIHTIVTSSGYKYTSEFISGIKPGIDVITLKSSIEAVGGNNTVTVKNLNGEVVYDGLIGTGFIVSINNQEKTEELKIVIKGDTSGDGVINALDLLQVQKNILGTYTLNSASSLAGDTSGDGTINALDLLQVQKSILGTFEIEQ